MRDLPHGTVTLVFTDIEGSTRLLHELGDRYRDTLEQHRALLRDAFSSHGGIEVDTQGDAFFYAFARARDAVEAAARAQQALEDHRWSEGHQVRVRIGVHSGEPEVSDEGYVGEDVHVGARIASAAHGGQVLLSVATERLLPASIEGIGLRDLGQHSLKDLGAKQHLYQLVIEGLRSDFPPLRTLDARPHNLPRQLSALIGRDHEVQEACSFLRRNDIAIVTLTGPGGTGKTRLALEVAGELVDDFPDGVFLVDLSSVTDPALVVPSIAGALSLRESIGRTLQETLEDYLSDKEMLLVLDNFEQVMDAAAEVGSLLASAAGLKMLITSREPLHVQGEREFPVPPLHLPTAGTLEQVASAPAVILFVERADAVRPGFKVTQDNATSVAAICRRLDGLPLAIELAAARTKLLSPGALLRRLDQSLTVLSSGRRDASKRQRTLRGAISWSYDLLSQGEQRLFRRVGVFAGGWTLEAAEQVCDRGDELGVLDGLASLLDKSLVRPVEGDRDRYTMLETIREFALGKLEESGETDEIRRAHAEFFRGRVEEAEPHLTGAEDKRWLDQLEEDHDNFRAALRWALRKDSGVALSLAAHLRRFWDIRGYMTEARRWLGEVLRQDVADSAVKARAMLGAGVLAGEQGDLEEARRLINDALTIFQDCDDGRDIVSCFMALARVASMQGDITKARALSEQAVTAARQRGDEQMMSRALINLGERAMEASALPEARALYEEALALLRPARDYGGLLWVLTNLGELELHSHNTERAKDYLEEALSLAERAGDSTGRATALANLGLAALLEHDPDGAEEHLRVALEVGSQVDFPYLVAGCLDALAIARFMGDEVEWGARLLGAAERVRRQVGLPDTSLDRLLYETHIAAAMTALGQEGWREAVAQGKTMAVEDVLGAPVVRKS